MNDEINIKRPGQILDYVDTKEHLLELYNYITNLQQENERLNHQLELQKELTVRNRLRKHCYKSRVEKAIKKSVEVKDHIDKSKFDGMTKSIIIMAINEIIYVLNGKRSDE